MVLPRLENSEMALNDEDSLHLDCFFFSVSDSDFSCTPEALGLQRCCLFHVAAYQIFEVFNLFFDFLFVWIKFHHHRLDTFHLRLEIADFFP